MTEKFASKVLGRGNIYNEFQLHAMRSSQSNLGCHPAQVSDSDTLMQDKAAAYDGVIQNWT